MNRLTPMMQQFKKIKNEHPDAILFFRVGDFYEMFFDDAIVASRELEIALTSRDGKKEGAIPLAGIPYHAAPGYLARFLEKGYKVAICEQTEEAGKGRGLVKREVTRVITPGTIVEEDFLQKEYNNYLAAIAQENNNFGLALVDISTGEIQAYVYEGNENSKPAEQIFDQLARLKPAEIILEDTLPKSFPNLFNLNKLKNFTPVNEKTLKSGGFEEAWAILKEQLPAELLQKSGLQNCRPATFAVALALKYILKMQRGSLAHIHALQLHKPAEALFLDAITVRNLEIFEALYTGEKKDSLWGVLNRTKTAMGARLLRKWLERPLLEGEALELRWNAVEELKNKQLLKDDLAGLLRQCYDLERLSGKINLGYINPRDLLALKKTLLLLPQVKQILQQTETKQFKYLKAQIPILAALSDKLEKAISDEAPLALKEGGIFKEGCCPEIDELRQVTKNSKLWLLELEKKEKERSGIRSLKIGFNRVFGYYLEISKANLELVPENYIRRQTLVNSERYITAELKEKEDLILNAAEKLNQLEYELFEKLRLHVARYIKELQQAGRVLAQIDCLFALAALASTPGYSKPRLSRTGEIRIQEGRHPVVERLQDTVFVPNDIYLDENNERILMLTGPNMAGKSTYCRSVALILLMAQIGSFVPAAKMCFSPVERIFARVGASDDLSGGRSTFMVEMEETATILKEATPHSLVIMDEIGRGTSTYDGMSLAQAILEYLHQKPGVKVLFSTHYHELTALEEKLPALKNFTVSVKEKGEKIIFLRKIVPGRADKSYGINVARLAGLPAEVITKAYRILQNLETATVKPATGTAGVARPAKNNILPTENVLENNLPAFFKSREGQLSLLPHTDKNKSKALLKKEREVIGEIKKMKVVNTTPLEALNILFRLQAQLAGENSPGEGGQ
jgi:DNA mismatch repair protein MutS